MYFQELSFVFESTRMCLVCIILKIRVLVDFTFFKIVVSGAWIEIHKT